MGKDKDYEVENAAERDGGPAGDASRAPDGPRGRIRTRGRARKEARRARWAPYSQRREAMEADVSAMLSGLFADRRFLTALSAAMAVTGFFWMPAMEVVALVGALAMRRHWAQLAASPDASQVAGMRLWRALAAATVPIAVLGCVAVLARVVLAVVSGNVLDLVLRP